MTPASGVKIRKRNGEWCNSKAPALSAYFSLQCLHVDSYVINWHLRHPEYAQELIAFELATLISALSTKLATAEATGLRHAKRFFFGDVVSGFFSDVFCRAFGEEARCECVARVLS